MGAPPGLVNVRTKSILDHTALPRKALEIAYCCDGAPDARTSENIEATRIRCRKTQRKACLEVVDLLFLLRGRQGLLDLFGQDLSEDNVLERNRGGQSVSGCTQGVWRDTNYVS